MKVGETFVSKVDGRTFVACKDDGPIACAGCDFDSDDDTLTDMQFKQCMEAPDCCADANTNLIFKLAVQL